MFSFKQNVVWTFVKFLLDWEINVMNDDFVFVNNVQFLHVIVLLL